MYHTCITRSRYLSKPMLQANPALGRRVPLLAHLWHRWSLGFKLHILCLCLGNLATLIRSVSGSTNQHTVEVTLFILPQLCSHRLGVEVWIYLGSVLRADIVRQSPHVASAVTRHRRSLASRS